MCGMVKPHIYHGGTEPISCCTWPEFLASYGQDGAWETAVRVRSPEQVVLATEPLRSSIHETSVESTLVGIGEGG